MSSEPAVHSVFAQRFSPVAFVRGAVITDAEVDTILEAARLAPSAGNSQPWMFIVGRRGDDVHGRLVRHLAPSSLRWAPDASMIVANVAHVLVEGTEWEYSEFSRYDLGQAVAHMTMQGLAMGFDAHQFRAFDRDAVGREFGVPQEWEVTSMTAFGVAAHRAGEMSAAGVARDRRTLHEVTWARDRGATT